MPRLQAEAPPGPLFTKAKAAMAEDGASGADLAFYFVHWLTDLSGAEAMPLAGATKFTIKFPHKVLQSFIESFSVVQRLAYTPPTELMQQFLEGAWPRHDLGALPTNEHEQAIAIMRLVVQAQTAPNQKAIYRAFQTGILKKDKQLLSSELALSGVAAQPYPLAPTKVGGPTFLVYYAPAFLQNLALDEPRVALTILADVLRAARAMWPLESGPEAEGRSVTIHIGQLKGKPPSTLTQVHDGGGCWLLVKKGALDGVVEEKKLLELPELMATSECQVLPLWASHLNTASWRSKWSGVRAGVLLNAGGQVSEAGGRPAGVVAPALQRIQSGPPDAPGHPTGVAGRV